MARVVEAVQIFKKVEDVTAAKDDPSPVYLMDELAEMARGSAESSEKIADRIAKRLQNKSPVVKFKALRLIRHLLNKGCGQFQRTMQRHASLVRDHIHFRGEPDPFKGDTQNQRVRDAAKEASEALFNTVMAQPVTSLGSRIQGFGSSAAPPPSSNNSSHGAGPGSSASTSGSRMVGFGSSSYAAPAATNSGNGGAGFGSSSQKGVNRPLTGSYGDAGGAGAASAGGHGAGGAYTAPVVTATEVFGSEAQLVDSICTPGGLRLAPDSDDLRRFVEAAGSMDGLKLAELLRDKLDGSGPWQQQLRALYSLEAVLLLGSSQACGEIAVMFQSDPGPVQAAIGHTQAAVRERAGRVLKVLVGDDTPLAAAAPPAAAPAAAAPQMAGDLLGGLDMLGSPVQGGYSGHQQQQPRYQQQPQQHQSGAGAGAGSEDIFSGLALPVGPGTAQQAAFNQAVQQPIGGLTALHGHTAPLQQQHGATAVGSRPPVDPFTVEFMQPAAAQPQAMYAPQQPQHPQQQQRPVQQPNPQQAYGALGGGGGGMQQMAAMPTGPVPGISHAVQAPQPVAAAAAAAALAPQAGNVRPPLDDMFADMSISSHPAAGGAAAGPAAGAAYGTGSNAYGGGGPAYGGAGVMGYGNPAGTYGTGAPQAHMAAPSSSGFGGVAPLGPTQYATPQGMAMAAPPQQQQPQQHLQPQQLARPAAPGGYGTGAGVGPGSAGVGMGPYPGAPSSGAGAGLGPAVGMGVNGGGGMMVGPGGQVRFVGSGGQPSPVMGPAGPMGPANGQLSQQQHSMASGHVYAGGWQQPYGAQQQQPYGAQQQQPYGVQQQQPYGAQQQQPYGVQQQQPYGAQQQQQQPYGAQQQQQQPYGAQQQHPQQHVPSAVWTPQQPHTEQQRGGAAFDFVRDQFK